MKFNSIPEILDDLRNGKMVIIVDDEDRENEGDLLMPAETLLADDVNFMAKYGRGLICLTLTRDRCQRLNLPLMQKSGDSVRSTNFTVSIEAAEGVTTGISAADRATTIKAATRIDAKPADLVQPGHVFPLMAEDGGVLVRAGHTEAGCDLARMAGFEPASVIVEILNDDGSMARRDDLETFAQQHQLKIATIEELIRYRTQTEKVIKRLSEIPFASEHGDFQLVTFQDSVHNVTHLALVKGQINAAEPTLVRVHVENPLHDLYASKNAHGWPLQDAMRRIGESKQGVLVVLSQPQLGVSLLERVKQYQQAQLDGNAAPSASAVDEKTSGIGAQILSDLGVQQMILLSAPRNYAGLNAFGLEIIDYIEH